LKLRSCERRRLVQPANLTSRTAGAFGGVGSSPAPSAVSCLGRRCQPVSLRAAGSRGDRTPHRAVFPAPQAQVTAGDVLAEPSRATNIRPPLVAAPSDLHVFAGTSLHYPQLIHPRLHRGCLSFSNSRSPFCGLGTQGSQRQHGEIPRVSARSLVIGCMFLWSLCRWRRHSRPGSCGPCHSPPPVSRPGG